MARTVHVKNTPRSSDERVLRALNMRLDRLTWDQIALELDCGNRSTMKDLCLRVELADREESGEPIKEVKQWYR